MKTSTRTARGATWVATATCGCPRTRRRDGRRITPVTGCGWIRGVGRGSMTRRGDMRRTTMAAGRTSMAGGAGCRGRSHRARLCAGAGGVRGWWTGPASGSRRRGGRWRRGGVVRARAAGSVSASVRGEPDVCTSGERDQRYQCHERHERDGDQHAPRPMSSTGTVWHRAR